MKVEIPEFLLEMSAQMNEQDNRITADPIWMVCYDKEHVTEEGYGDFAAFYGEDGGKICDDSDLTGLSEYLDANHSSWFRRWIKEELDEDDDAYEGFADRFDPGFDELPSCVSYLHISKRMEVVKACLTEADANWFIQRKQHDYPKLYTYVYSMCYCPQMIKLRNWILSLTK